MRARLGVLALAGIAASAVTAGCGSGGHGDPDLSAIPTTAASRQPTSCGALPTKALQLAVGTPKIKVVDNGPGLDKMKGTVASGCFVYSRGANRTLLLDITYSTGRESDNKTMLAGFRADKEFSRLPADLGTGILNDPWSSKAPSAQATLMNGGDRLQVTLDRGPEQRDQSKDVLALARLLNPYFLAS